MSTKIIFVLVCSVVLTECSQQNAGNCTTSDNQIYYGKQLFEADFLTFVGEDEFDSVKSGLVNSFDIYNEANNKIAHIDAEELAEFSFDFSTPRLKEILGKRGFSLDVRPDKDYQNTNDVFINDRRVNLFTSVDPEKGTFWESASRNFFREINNQLHDSQIDESFYLLYGGNDLHALLLTDERYMIIAQYYADVSEEVPYLP